MLYPEEDVWDEINDGWSRMSIRQRHLWEAIKCAPTQWVSKEHGSFWVVALLGETAVYYNHHEEGFDAVSWTKYGEIGSLQSSQLSLHEVVQHQLNRIESGYDTKPRTRGPFAGEYIE